MRAGAGWVVGSERRTEGQQVLTPSQQEGANGRIRAGHAPAATRGHRRRSRAEAPVGASTPEARAGAEAPDAQHYASCKHAASIRKWPELCRHTCARREREGTVHTSSRRSKASGTTCPRKPNHPSTKGKWSDFVKSGNANSASPLLCETTVCILHTQEASTNV